MTTCRPATKEDLPAIVAIYNEAIEDAATADTAPVNAPQRVAWLADHPPDRYPVIVAEEIPDADVAVAAASGALTAWAALLARPIVGRLGARAAVPVGMGLGLVGYVLGTIAFTSGVAVWVLPAAVLLGAASGTLTASSLGILGELAEPAERGAINSTVFLLAYPGMAMPIVLTAIAGVLTLTTALIAVTVVAAGACTWALNAPRLTRR